MDGLRAPPNPANNKKILSTPNNGVLYIAGAYKTIAYVSPPIESKELSEVKLIVLKHGYAFNLFS